jgi:hypothetical protein
MSRRCTDNSSKRGRHRGSSRIRRWSVHYALRFLRRFGCVLARHAATLYTLRSVLPRRSGGMADAAVSKTADRKVVWVRLPPPAPPHPHHSAPLLPTRRRRASEFQATRVQLSDGWPQATPFSITRRVQLRPYHLLKTARLQWRNPCYHDSTTARDLRGEFVGSDALIATWQGSRRRMCG